MIVESWQHALDLAAAAGLPTGSARAMGSRESGTHHAGSDWDILLEAPPTDDHRRAARRLRATTGGQVDIQWVSDYDPRRGDPARHRRLTTQPK